MHFAFQTRIKKRLADTDTPISIYLKIRDQFPESILLESSDQNGKGHSYSYICCQPIASITVDKEQIKEKYPDGSITITPIAGSPDVMQCIASYIAAFSIDSVGHAFSINGLFGHINYDAVRYFETVKLTAPGEQQKKIPDIRLSFYRLVLVFDHFKNEYHIIEHILGDNEPSNIEILESIINHKHIPSYPFKAVAEEQSNFTDNDFLDIIAKGKRHCNRGDVFQIVLSRGFSKAFSGDEFNVYRALRSINPSPYLFYFDYGDYKLFGSSPEAQLKIKKDKATIHPIAGTYRRTGDEEKDKELALHLAADKKENAEHTMLVDLARNDLSRNYKKVIVSVYKEIQFFSHVIHIVSEVTGEQPLVKGNSLKVVAETFPAGTLSGAPKYRALQLIGKYENSARGFYGGCIGYLGFDGEFNMAIMIRSFLSKNSILFYQAGAGIVASSVAESELQEVNSKLGALRRALETAKTI